MREPCITPRNQRAVCQISEQNMADFFTKPLAASTFFRLRNIIMNGSFLIARAGFVFRAHGARGVWKISCTVYAQADT